MCLSHTGECGRFRGPDAHTQGPDSGFCNCGTDDSHTASSQADFHPCPANRHTSTSYRYCYPDPGPNAAASTRK
jgi:hypothetical protein